MNTRGAMIGAIIDNFERIANQARVRGQMHLFDLHTHVETVFKQILDEAFGCNLINLNADEPNSPGLDLGDIGKRVAFQITADKRSSKINETLGKITDEQLNLYDKIYILTVVERQSSYTIIDNLAQRVHGFTEDQIIDYRNVVKLLMDLRLDKVRAVHNVLQAETQRVIIELEVPDEDGNFSTSLRELVEAIPIPKMGSGRRYVEFADEKYDAKHDLEQIVAELSIFSKKLTRLPRMTREFYTLALERADFEEWRLGREERFVLNAEKAKRIFRAFDWKGEYDILEDEGFASYNEREDHYSPASFTYCGNGLEYITLKSLLDFIEKEGISKSKVLVALDFSDF